MCVCVCVCVCMCVCGGGGGGGMEYCGREVVRVGEAGSVKA